MPLSTELIFLQQIRDASNTTLDVILNNIDANVAAAYAQANLAITEISAAYSQANTAYGQANAAFLQANTVFAKTNLAYTQANSAFTAANVAQSQAASALTAANAANNEAQAAFTQANVAVAAAAVANGLAQSAFNEANVAFAEATQTVIAGQIVGDGSGYKTTTFSVDARGRITAAGSTSIPIFDNGVAGLVPAAANNPNLYLNAGGAFSLIAGSLANTSLLGSGYAQFENGLMLQWGVVSLNSIVTTGSRSTVVNYPKTFTNGAFAILATPNGTTNDSDGYTVIATQVRNQTSFTMWFRGVNTIGELGDAFWIAIGV